MKLKVYSKTRSVPHRFIKKLKAIWFWGTNSPTGMDAGPPGFVRVGREPEGQSSSPAAGVHRRSPWNRLSTFSCVIHQADRTSTLGWPTLWGRSNGSSLLPRGWRPHPPINATPSVPEAQEYFAKLKQENATPTLTEEDLQVLGTEAPADLPLPSARPNPPVVRPGVFIATSLPSQLNFIIFLKRDILWFFCPFWVWYQYSLSLPPSLLQRSSNLRIGAPPKTTTTFSMISL